jgi:GAF domain-containing protein
VASNRNSHPTNAAGALERLGRLSLRQLSMESLLQAVADLSKTVMPGNPETSVLLLVKGHPTAVVSTDQLAVDLDERQYERGHGPCLHAARTGELTEIADTRTDSRWRDYTRRAAERGNLSSLSVPLIVDADEQVTGALDICARKPDAFDEDTRAAATRFGPYAAVAAGNMYAYRSARDMAENL